MFRRICITVLIPLFLFINYAYADLDEESGYENAVHNLICSVVPEETILCVDMTSMDIRTGSGNIYLITEEKGKFNFLILEISQSEIKSLNNFPKAIYQDRGAPEFYVETDGEVTITYPTGEGATFIKNGENWILSGYRVVTDGNYMLNIGFLDNNFVECTEIDEDGVVMKRTTIPYVFDGSLLLEQLDVQALPKSEIEIKREH